MALVSTDSTHGAAGLRPHAEQGQRSRMAGQRQPPPASAGQGVGAQAARLASLLGNLPDAVVAARQSVDLDPYSDTSWALLAELYETAGKEART